MMNTHNIYCQMTRKKMNNLICLKRCVFQSKTLLMERREYYLFIFFIIIFRGIWSCFQLLKGLDPKSTANLFANSICTGEKTINGEDCFVLKLEVEPSSLKQRSSNNVEIIKHTIWGYFSQKTGLLHHLKDSNLIRIKAHGSGNVFWETTMESLIQDYRTVEGINIAHGGVTTVLLFRYGENENHSRTKMEEVWTIEELDFNIKGLSMDCFLPPSDLNKGLDHEAGRWCCD